MNSELETEMYVLPVVDTICSVRPVLKAFCLLVFHKPDSHLTLATSSGQLAAGVQDRGDISSDPAWLFPEERSAQRQECVAHGQCTLAHMNLGIIP